MAASVQREFIRIRDGGESSIYLLFGSAHSPKAAGLFELKLRYAGIGEGDGKRICAVNEKLKLIETFYDQTDENPVNYVACVPLGDGRYFVMPNEINRAMSSEILFPPCIYHDRTIETAESPKSPKDTPLVAIVGNKVYVLCRRTTNELYYHIPPESSFEAYDPDNNSWESLVTPWFNITDGLFRHYPVGFAVVGECIIVCLEDAYPVPEHSPFCCYNTIFKKWRYVRLSPQVSESDSDEQNKLIWYGEAVFKDGFIYGYVSPCQGLASFSYKMPSKEDPFITIGMPIFVKYYEYLPWDCCEQWSHAVALMEDDLLCVALTAPIGYDVQPVHMSLLRITEPGICTTLTVLDLLMPCDDLFHFADIKSCLIVQLKLDTSMDNNEGRGGKKIWESSCDASMISYLEVLKGTMPIP